MYLRPAAPLPTRVRWLLCGLVYLGVYASLATPVQAGMIGFPAPRLDPWQFRFGILGDSFKADLKNGGDAEAISAEGRSRTSSCRP